MYSFLTLQIDLRLLHHLGPWLDLQSSMNFDHPIYVTSIINLISLERIPYCSVECWPIIISVNISTFMRSIFIGSLLSQLIFVHLLVEDICMMPGLGGASTPCHRLLQPKPYLHLAHQSAG